MTKPRYRLRQATAADYDFLYNLHVTTMKEYIAATWEWHDDWQEEYFRQKFDPRQNQIIQVDRVDVGTLVVEEKEDELYLGLIEILPAYQGRGIGTAIIESLLEQAQQLQRPLTLHVLKSNAPARRLYERLGFVIVADEDVRYKMSHPLAQ